MMHFILFYLNLWLNIYFLNNFANTHGYPWIPADMKKIGGYPHNGYLMDMDTGMGKIFIQRVGYELATTRTLLVPLTSLVHTMQIIILLNFITKRINIKFFFYKIYVLAEHHTTYQPLWFCWTRWTLQKINQIFNIQLTLSRLSKWIEFWKKNWNYDAWMTSSSSEKLKLQSQ